MAFRKRMSRRSSRRVFSKGNRIKGKNFSMGYRGGIRL